MKYKVIRVISLLLAFALFFGCASKKNPAGPGDGGTTGTVTTGERTQVAAQAVGSGGGVIRVEKAGDPLNGLEISVPAGAFSGGKNITVSEAAVTSHKLGANVNAISPLITVGNVTGYASEPVTVKIPVTVPEGHLAMGVLYDETTGRIEGLPLADLTATSVTVTLRTFVPSPAPSSSGKQLFKHLGSETASVGNILVVSVDESKLKANPVISTGFTPGVDDWEFINRGSYISPGGHCAGQSVSAMWYFYEKKLRGSPFLYHQFDRVQDSREVLWQDNPRGYRFASTIQEDLDWDSLSRKLFVAIRETPAYHHLSWKCFALSMYLTGEPQYVGLKSDKGGHAIIAYKVDYANGILYVADPNYPGQERKIKYNGVQFDPYSTKQNDNEPAEHPYTGIGYFAKSSLIDWDRIGARWKELENVTIGNDRFPQCRLWVFDGGAWHELAPSEVVNADSIVVRVQWKNGTNDNRISMTVFDGKGGRLAPESAYGYSSVAETIRLKPGENILGFHIWGDKGVAPAENWRWLDFQWVPVVYSSLSIDPKSLTGQKGVDVTFTAVAGSPPASAKYLWNFGDGTSEVSMLNNPKVTHKYAADGDYTVTLRLYDAGAKPEKLLGAAQAGAKIGVTLGRVRNVKTWLPTGEPVYGLKLDAYFQDSVALIGDWITLHMWPQFDLTSGGRITKDIPMDYKIYVDGSPVKNGVIILYPISETHAQGNASVNIGSLSKGSHTIRLVLDPDLKITDPAIKDRDLYRIIDHKINIVESL